jgi:hypothetical protein
LLLLFLLPGGMAPTPAFAQYFYVLVPFIVLWILYTLAAAMRDNPSPKPLTMPAALAGICIIAGIPTYFPEKHWTLATSAPLLSHRTGFEIHRLAGDGKVLTLTPLFPLEGGCDIYEAYATGTFAARIAPMLNEDQLHEVHLYDERLLLDQLRQHPPIAELAGTEGETDEPLRRYAMTHARIPPIRIAGMWLWIDHSDRNWNQ